MLVKQLFTELLNFQLSKSEIWGANFILPANGTSPGSYLVLKSWFELKYIFNFTHLKNNVFWTEG